MKTKLHLIIMSLFLLFMAGGQSVCLAAESWSYPTSKPTNPFGGGDGSQWNPYRIDNAQQLANLSYMVTKEGENYEGKYFVLTNDITLNDDVLNASGTGLRYDVSNYKEWTPIGDRSVWDYGIFKGIFDGQGHTIRGMVCAKTNEREYTGLFETIEYATIKNINMEDCCIKDDDAKKSSNFGILCGEAWNTCTIINCTISKSAIIIKSELDVCVGGILGSFRSIEPLHISNCSFNGYISFRQDDYYKFWFAGKCIGGILGFNNEGNAKLHINNCSSSGDIQIYCSHNNEKYYYYIGGLGGNLHSECAFFSNCVSSMNINIDSPNSGIGYCNVGGLVNYQDSKRSFSNCVYLGKIRVGYAGSPAKMEELKVCGIGGSNSVNGCAFYGKMDIHCKATHKIIIAGITNKHIIGDNYKQNIVYSAGNVIDIDAPTTKIDQVCNEIEDGKKHKDFYCFGLSNGNSVECKYSYNPATYSKSLDQMKEDNFISTLNQDAGSNVWGKLTGTNSDLDGLPMPIACGCKPIEYTGKGTETEPYVINTENDLNKLKEAVNDGSTFVGKYFKLGSDISITGALDECIGKDYDHPFKGHFDGNGHVIKGLHKSLFGYMYGTVKNLALVDCDIWVNGYATALARQVGGTDNKAEVSNCYVSGIIASSASWNSQGCASTFAFQVADGSSIHDCYFKGRFVLKNQGLNSYFVAGIAVYDSKDVNISADSPQGIFNCYASFDVKEESSGITTYYCYGICNRNNDNSSDNYFVCSNNRLQPYNGGTKLDSESKLNEQFKDKSAWLQGVYRPVLASAKKYAATTPEATPKTVYFDAIPEVNPTPNYFYNISIEDPYSDVSLWNLPNMSVYVPSEQVDYIPNGYLDQSSEFKYKRSEGATATLGQLHFALTQNDKGTHFVCLPGEVLKSDLPEGSDAMIGGKVNIVNDEEQVNVVHVDTIPAGVPCLLYVPVSSVQSGEEIDILMRSGIVSEPVLNADYSSFKGTFTPQAVSEDACLEVAKETTARSATRSAAQDDTYYFIRGNDDTQVKPFSSWLEGSLGNVRIVDYMLLDEYNNTNVELIESSTDDVNIKLRLTMDADKWTTICLPFDMSTEEIVEKFGEDTKLEEVESISYEGSTLNIKLKEATDGIVSGSPYFIKPSVSNSIFDLGPRILSNELAEVGNLAYSPDANQEIYLKMVGWFDISMLQSAEEFKAYYFNDGTLCELPKDYTMILGGFRCWFKASDSTASAPAELSSVIITHSDGTITDINVVASDPQSTKQPIYDLNGIEKKTEKGIYIKGGKVRIKN